MGSTHTPTHGEDPHPKKPWVETPLIESGSLSQAAGCRIFLKLENLQPSGSFKSRGIGNLMLSSLSSYNNRNKNKNNSNPKKPHFYSSSGGNAGLACVVSAAALNCPCTVIVPHSTSAYMIAKLRAAGARAVVQHGDSWQEADQYLREEALAQDAEGVYVPPFDDEEIWRGHATLVEELSAQWEEGDRPPEAIVCSVGGGGLFSGVMMGLDNVGWERVKVLAMETHGAESLNRSLEAGELVTLESITSVATTLGAKKVCGMALQMAQRERVTSVVMRDAEAVMGCWRLADDERILVEPACGVSVAVCYDGRLRKLLPGLTRESKVVVVVCGGSNVSLDMLMGYREKYGWIEKETTDDAEVPSTVAVQNDERTNGQ